MVSLMPAICLFAVLAAIFFRSRLPIRIAPWQAMAAGALIVLLFGQISPSGALSSIDWGVVAFLYSTFVLASILQESGYLQHLGYKFMRSFYQHPFLVLLAFIFSAGAASAFLLNDTVAILGVPLCIELGRKSNVPVAPLLVALALAVTVGGITSPIGSPHNYIIATQGGMVSPFSDFVYYLFVPTVLSLVALAAICWLLFPDLHRLKTISSDFWKRGKEYKAARAGFMAVVGLSALRVLSGVVPWILPFPLYIIPLAGAAVAVARSSNWKYSLETDWETLAFFLAMFILMAAVWQSGFFQQFLPPQAELSGTGVILFSSLVLSQFLSNVPLVILYLKALGASPATHTLILLVAGSTLAGALTLIGAASNIIIMQAAEKKGHRFPFREFTIAGVAITIVSLALILGWLSLVGG
ncbi:Citrate transporter [uncultured archaeon]|nr:Citrate transporter [uncultured archaeon]